MVRIDDSAVVWRKGTGPDLILAMHGFGADERDLAGIAPHLPEQFTVAALRGPNPSPMGAGYAWFEFNPAIDNTDHTLVKASAEAVLAWLDSGIAEKYARVHALGFSQGGVMAVELARLAPTRFASVVHLSSFAHNGDLPGDAELAAMDPKVPLFQGIGHDDNVIAANKRERSIPWLDAHFDVERHYYERGHTITLEELQDVSAFLNRV